MALAACRTCAQDVQILCRGVTTQAASLVENGIQRPGAQGLCLFRGADAEAIVLARLRDPFGPVGTVPRFGVALIFPTEVLRSFAVGADFTSR